MFLYLLFSISNSSTLILLSFFFSYLFFYFRRYRRPQRFCFSVRCIDFVVFKEDSVKTSDLQTVVPTKEPPEKETERLSTGDGPEQVTVMTTEKKIIPTVSIT